MNTNNFHKAMLIVGCTGVLGVLMVVGLFLRMEAGNPALSVDQRTALALIVVTYLLYAVLALTMDVRRSARRPAPRSGLDVRAMVEQLRSSPVPRSLFERSPAEEAALRALRRDEQRRRAGTD